MMPIVFSRTTVNFMCNLNIETGWNNIITMVEMGELDNGRQLLQFRMCILSEGYIGQYKTWSYKISSQVKQRKD